MPRQNHKLLIISLKNFKHALNNEIEINFAFEVEVEKNQARHSGVSLLMENITERDSSYRHLEKMSVLELLQNINREDQKVASVVQEIIPNIAPFVEITTQKMQSGGRLFYLGAGTSGRLGVLDAAECPPTFGVPPDRVVGIIAGGDAAIRQAQEFAEDSPTQAWADLQTWNADEQDVVIGIAASGTTPYVVHGLRMCRQHQITTGCITCNPGAPITEAADYPIVAVVGPEFVTGSSRMKAGTAQKLILNMISTTVMIRLGRIKDNKMVDMQLTNNKLIERGTRIVADQLNIDQDTARKLLLQYGSVREALKNPPTK